MALQSGSERGELEASWAAIDDGIGQLLLPADPALEHAEAATEAAGLPDHGISPNQGLLLQVLARSRGAQSILEIGTFAGYSTIWLARALPFGGRLISLELDPGRAELARRNLATAGLGSRVEVRVGDALASLDHLVTAEGQPFDFVFIDADKERNPEYLERVLELTCPGALIVADNVIRAGAVFDPEVEDPVLDARALDGLRRFLEMLGSDPRVLAAAFQTVGAKGHDGFAIAVTREVDPAPGAGQDDHPIPPGQGDG
jgi:predicted O-methyltransferase YrrM